MKPKFYIHTFTSRVDEELPEFKSVVELERFSNRFHKELSSVVSEWYSEAINEIEWVNDKQCYVTFRVKSLEPHKKTVIEHLEELQTVAIERAR